MILLPYFLTYLASKVVMILRLFGPPMNLTVPLQSLEIALPNVCCFPVPPHSLSSPLPLAPFCAISPSRPLVLSPSPPCLPTSLPYPINLSLPLYPSPPLSIFPKFPSNFFSHAPSSFLAPYTISLQVIATVGLLLSTRASGGTGKAPPDVT